MTTPTNGSPRRASVLTFCARPRNLRRAAITSVIVGPILTAINQTAVLAALAALQPVPRLALVRIALTFAVPFAVSLVSSALADRARETG